jgi:hypothetical protein
MQGHVRCFLVGWELGLLTFVARLFSFGSRGLSEMGSSLPPK